MSQKTVLVCCGVNRRPITFVSEDGISDLDKVKEKILNSFSEVLSIDDGVNLLIQVSINS